MEQSRMKRKIMMSIVKKALAGGLALAIMITSAFQIQTENVQAATPKWKTAYTNILNNRMLIEKYQDVSYLKRYFGEDYKFNKYYYYDLDKNGIPELFLYSSTMGLTQIFTYNKKPISLGYYDIAKINKSKKEIIVKGHWHGAGGSGDKEWSIYAMNKSKNKINMKYYMDIMGNRVTVYNGNWKLLSSKKSYYNSIYNSHIKTATSPGKFNVKKFMQTKDIYGTYKDAKGNRITIKKFSGYNAKGEKCIGKLTMKYTDGTSWNAYIGYVEQDKYIQVISEGSKVVALLRLGVTGMTVEFRNNMDVYVWYKKAK